MFGDSTSQSLGHDRYRYDPTQRGFHWLMAAIIFVAIAIGIYASDLPTGTALRRGLLDIHKSLGMTALVLAVFRLIYRVIRGAPAYRQPPAPWSHAAAVAVHFSLYGLMLFMPITGYLSSAAGGYSLPWFGVFSWPRLVPHDKPLAHLGEHFHIWGAWIICALLTVHILAVIWHQWIKKDEVLARMLPLSRSREAAAVRGDEPRSR
jgi:cytochrome b561